MRKLVFVGLIGILAVAGFAVVGCGPVTSASVAIAVGPPVPPEAGIYLDVARRPAGVAARALAAQTARQVLAARLLGPSGAPSTCGDGATGKSRSRATTGGFASGDPQAGPVCQVGSCKTGAMVVVASVQRTIKRL